MAKRAQIEAAPQGGYLLHLCHPTGGFLEVAFAGSLEGCVKRLEDYFKEPPTERLPAEENHATH